MADIVIGGILLVVVGLAVGYLVKAKKNGRKCIGCPSGGCCPHKKGNHSTCQCSSGTDERG